MNARWLLILGFAVMVVTVFTGPPTPIRAGIQGAGFGMFLTALIVKENP